MRALQRPKGNAPIGAQRLARGSGVRELCGRRSGSTECATSTHKVNRFRCQPPRAHSMGRRSKSSAVQEEEEEEPIRSSVSSSDDVATTKLHREDDNDDDEPTPEATGSKTKTE